MILNYDFKEDIIEIIFYILLNKNSNNFSHLFLKLLLFSLYILNYFISSKSFIT